jgi:protein phosphatase
MMRERPFRTPLTAIEPSTWGDPATAGALIATGHTDRGRRRENNEDCFAVAPLADDVGTLLVVADGLGGAEGGEVASRTAVDTLIAELTRQALPADTTPRARLKQAVEHANEALREVAQRRPELQELGTTVTAALVIGNDLWVAHVGDSRAYRWRSGQLEQLTRDHTMAQKLRDEGLVQPQQRVPNWESVLWNALGPSGEPPQVEERHERLAPGDGLLLCSDGLTRHLADAELRRALARRAEPRDISRRLVDEANRAGGEDNITAIVAQVGSR